MKKIEIYQMPIEHPGVFMNLEFNQKKGFNLTKSAYKQVYSCERAGMYCLNDAWNEFNYQHPADYRGRSLSVSDVVVIIEDGTQTAYFVDSFGFKTLADFFKEEDVV